MKSLTGTWAVVTSAVTVGLLAAWLASPARGVEKGGAEETSIRDDSAAEKLGWRLAVQAYSFKKFTFFEAVDKTASLGIRYIEAYPKQTVCADMPKATTHFSMSEETREAIREKLREAGVKLVCYGVTGAKDEAEWRQLFAFAKDMGIETITSEPKPEVFDLLDRLCEEYGVNIAIHNHPEPSRYWNPDTVLEVCQGRGGRIGACADTGHWMRSGVDPVEALRKLEGRLVSFHFKDLDEFGVRKAHDVPWGTGKADVKAMLGEVRRQGARGVFSIEYEDNWDNSMPEIAQCVGCFDRVAFELLGSDKGAD